MKLTSPHSSGLEGGAISGIGENDDVGSPHVGALLRVYQYTKAAAANPLHYGDFFSDVQKIFHMLWGNEPPKHGVSAGKIGRRPSHPRVSRPELEIPLLGAGLFFPCP